MGQAEVRERQLLDAIAAGKATINISEPLRQRLAEYNAFYMGAVGAANAAIAAANQAKAQYENIIESYLTELGVDPGDVSRAIDLKKGELTLTPKPQNNGVG